MSFGSRNLVLVHGLWDHPRVFSRLLAYLQRDDVNIFTPNLSHQFGRTSLNKLSYELDRLIINHYGCDVPINLLGFSMGGLISRIWLQKRGGAIRTSRFVSVGSPHRGTYTAQLVPSWLLRGVAEMKCGSYLIEDLNGSINVLHEVQCCSYFCKWDLMVFPGWHAILPVGPHYSLPVLTHKELITNPLSLKVLAKAMLDDSL